MKTEYKVLYWQDVQEGHSLPALSVPLTLTRCLLYASGLDSWDPQHHDRDLARSKGLRDFFLGSNMYASLLLRFLSDWCGPRGKVRRLTVHMLDMNCPGDVMTLSGAVVKKRVENGEYLVEVDFSIHNQNGLTTRGSAIVALPPGAN